MRKRDLVSIRPGIKTDEPLIYATWLQGLRYANDWFGLIEKTIYFNEYHKFIQQILELPNTKINIACLADDSDVILGYSVAQPEVLHWVFVKPAWRGIGLCKDLVSPNIKTVTHMTKLGVRLKPSHVIFNPFLKEATGG